MGVEPTRDMATNLYTAILTDTGGFHYSNTSRDSLIAAGNLVGKGADPQWISENVYGRNPLAKIRLLTLVLGTLTLDLEGKVASMIVLQKTLEEMLEVDGSKSFRQKKLNQIRLHEAVESETLKGATTKPMPHGIRPMLATPVKEAFEYAYQNYLPPVEQVLFRIFRVYLDEKVDGEKVIEKVSKDPDVAGINFYYPPEPLSMLDYPNDYYYHLYDAGHGIDYQWHLRDVGAEAAWRCGEG
jgi:hypothetical protein